MGRSRVNPHALQFCLGAGWGMRGPLQGYSSLLSARPPPNKLSIPPQVTSASGLCQYLASLPEKAMAPHSSTLAWKIPWTEESGGLQSMGPQALQKCFLG